MKNKQTKRLILAAVLHFAAIQLNNLVWNCRTDAKIIVGPVLSVEHGQMQFYYEDNEPLTINDSDEDYSLFSCQNVILLNVGTAMSVTDYHKLGTDIAEKGADQGIVAVIIDTNFGSMRKQSGPKFSIFVNTIYDRIDELIPICDKKLGSVTHPAFPTKFIVGGHSGGGEGAILSLMDGDLSLNVAGFIGLAPYKIVDSKYNIELPTLVWGFVAQSCGVKPEDAAMAAYAIAPSTHRVFYQVQHESIFLGHGLIGGPHCSFADNGCFGMCSGGSRYAYIPEAVGESVAKFVRALHSGDGNPEEFEKNDFVLANTYEGVRLVVNDDINQAIVSNGDQLDVAIN